MNLRDLLSIVPHRQRPFDIAAYWNNRHATHGSALTGVGYIGLSLAQNAADYEVKLSRVVSALERQIGPLRGKVILDAGCGIGMLAGALANKGAKVTGIDFSPNAISLARGKVPNVAFEVRELDAIESVCDYDAVVCMDVLFHVIDTEKWKNSLKAMLRAARRNDCLIIEEEFSGSGNAPHLRWRTLNDYETAFAQMNAKIVSVETYRLQMEQKDILVVRRLGEF